jgi:hypothetical protein
VAPDTGEMKAANDAIMKANIFSFSVIMVYSS